MDYIISLIFNNYSTSQLLFSQISSFFELPSWLEQILPVVKLLAGIFSILSFAFIVLIIIRLNRLMFSSIVQNVTASIHAENLPADKLAKQWTKIKGRISQNTEAEWKLAVIEADKLVDDILKKMGYPGEDMGDRLKSIKPEQLASLNILWEAHKLRNTIVHDTEFYASELEIKNAIDHYETFLKEVEVM